MKTQRGFVLLLVILSLSVLALLAFWLNREGGLRVARESAQIDTDRARYAAEAGLRALHAKHRAIGCDTLTGQSVSNSSFGSASYAASAPSASPVVLRSIGTYQGTTVSVSRPAPTDVIAAEDTYLDVTDQETYHGEADRMDISSTSSRFYWARFDLPAAPADKVLAVATLCLRTRAKSSNDNDVEGSVYRATRTWTYKATWTQWDVVNGSPACCNWTNPGGDFDATVWASNTADPDASDYWLDFEVTALVLDWVAGVYPNQGVRVALTDNFSEMELITRNHSTSSWRPRLRLEYRSP